MPATKLLVLGAVRIFQPVHGYLVRIVFERDRDGDHCGERRCDRSWRRGAGATTHRPTPDG